MGLQGVTVDCKRLQKVRRGYRQLQAVAGDFKR